MKKLRFSRILLGLVLCTIFLTACSGTNDEISSSSEPVMSSSSDIDAKPSTPEPPTPELSTPEPLTPESSSTPEPLTPESSSTPEPLTPESSSTPEPPPIINSTEPSTNTEKPEVNTNAMKKIDIVVGDTVFTATLENNPTAKLIAEKFPLNVSMGELNGNEKYYFMDTDFPTNSRKFDLVKAGDIMLYQSNCLVIFYEDCRNSYSYTKLGSIDDVAGLKSTLGNGSIGVEFRAKVN